MDRNALRKLGYGVYIVTSGKEDKCNGQIANTVFQITSDPEIIVVSISSNLFKVKEERPKNEIQMYNMQLHI